VLFCILIVNGAEYLMQLLHLKRKVKGISNEFPFFSFLMESSSVARAAHKGDHHFRRGEFYCLVFPPPDCLAARSFQIVSSHNLE